MLLLDVVAKGQVKDVYDVNGLMANGHSHQKRHLQSALEFDPHIEWVQQIFRFSSPFLDFIIRDYRASERFHAKYGT